MEPTTFSGFNFLVCICREVLAVYLQCFMKSYHCYILLHLSCNQCFSSQHAGHLLIILFLVGKKCPSGSLWHGRPGITVGRHRMDPCANTRLIEQVGRAEPGFLLYLRLSLPKLPTAAGLVTEIYFSIIICGTYGAGSYRRSPVSLEQDTGSFSAYPLSINFSFKGH